MTDLTRTVARFLLPPAWMVAFGVLVKGYADTGDGFSAGVIAGLAVLLQYLAYGPAASGKLLPARYARELAAAGLLIALIVTFLPVVRGDPVMTHRPGAEGHVIRIGSLELLTAVAFDIGVFLLVIGFVVGAIDLIARSLPPVERSAE